jgi:hypothetical protein
MAIPTFVFKQGEVEIYIESPDGLSSKEMTMDNLGNLNIDAKRVSAANVIALPFTTEKNPYIVAENDNYTKMAEFPYQGSNVTGAPSAIKIIASKSSNATDFSIRIDNGDNGDVICEVTGQTNDQMAIINMGTISNVPTTEAILEIYGKKTGSGAGKKGMLSSLLIEF